jgi:hypothetical protein
VEIELDTRVLRSTRLTRRILRKYIQREDPRSLRSLELVRLVASLGTPQAAFSPADLAKGDGSRAVPVGLLDSTGGGGGLAGGLGGELLPGSLSSGGLTSGLLGTGHV